MGSYRMTSFAAMSVATLLVLSGPSMAQQPTKDVGWGARVMMEPIILAYGGFAALCNPRAAARAQWGVEQIERAVKPTEAQRAAFNELKAAAAKATALTPSACPQGIPRTSRERLSFTALRIEAILEAIKTVAPAFATFYDSLGDEQKAQIDAGPPVGVGRASCPSDLAVRVAEPGGKGIILPAMQSRPAISPASVRVKDIFGILGCGSRRKKAKRFVSKSGLLAIDAQGGASVAPWR